MKFTHGGDIYSHSKGLLDFSVSLNPLGTPDGVIEAGIKSMKEPWVYPDMYCRDLRQAISRSVGISADNIICGCGAAELIFNTVLAIKPQRALVAMPAFAEYEAALDSVGCEKLFYFGSEKNGFVCGEDILSYIDETVDAVFICSPANPSGICTNRSLIERIAEKCRFLVLDECFMDFVKADGRYTARGLLSRHKNMLMLKSFTKLYAMPSVRLGYALCTDRRVIELMYGCRQPWSVSSAAQAMGIAALEQSGLKERTVCYVEHEREFLASALKECGIGVFPSQANYLLVKSDADLYALLLDLGILIRDCSDYRGLEKGFYRIAVREHEDNKRLIASVREVMQWLRL